MTVRQVAEWVEAFNKSTVARTKETIQMLDGQARQIVSGVAALLDKRAKYLTLPKLYPDLFGNRAETENLTPEQLANRQALVWREFLGV